MKSNGLNSILLFLEKIEHERDRALEVELKAQRALKAAKAQVEELMRYQGDYEQRWQLQAQQGQTVEVVQCHQNFMQQLNRAIVYQNQVIERAQAAVEKARAVLLEREKRAASIQKLVERKRHETERAALRVEQKTTDEQAARSARYAPVGISQFGPPSGLMPA